MSSSQVTLHTLELSTH